MWIKICGNTSLEDAQLAVECGANALGFIFAPSPRRVTEERASRIVSRLPAGVDSFGVFVDEDFAAILHAVTECGLTGVQLHGRSNQNFTAHLHDAFAGIGRRIKIVSVIQRSPARPDTDGSADQNADRNEEPSVAPADFDSELALCSRNPALDAVLVDTGIARAKGGTGVSFDWESARRSFRQAPPATRLIVAGGLRPGNVRSAIAVLQPWGVDVVSGVEAFPGKKDPALVQAFIQAVRDAETELSGNPVLAGVR